MYIILWIVMPSGTNEYYESWMNECKEQNETSNTTEKCQNTHTSTQLAIGITFIVAGILFLSLLFFPRFKFVDLCFVGLTLLGIFLVITSLKSKN